VPAAVRGREIVDRAGFTREEQAAIDRLGFDPRRIIQCGMLLFILVSLGWGYLFITDTLQMWQAVLLLVVHGCAGVLWAGVLWFTPVQVLLYDIVGPADLIPHSPDDALSFGTDGAIQI
jgi:hypothetical protein